MNLAALVLTAAVSTSSITSSKADLYRDLVSAVEVAEHLSAELDACEAGRRDERAARPTVDGLPGWLWPVAAVGVVVAFGAGVVVMASDR